MSESNIMTGKPPDTSVTNLCEASSCTTFTPGVATSNALPETALKSR
eukprot:CAMPEP_0183450994 /NCGR_PEP_ID=MMETSP0370-20130417/113969_1 /TAXON_ID=268820 /ORGANISM="Peridinium aciculiferum, Strain PAER-2" /LENGTH=46 /DNA_ID= /DNA_START= /DNA_END= /DNA_ORIENTATION=